MTTSADLKSLVPEIEPEHRRDFLVNKLAVGFALAVPDVNIALKPANGNLFPFGLVKILYYQRKVRSLRVMALGVIEEHRTAGVAAGFYATLIKQAQRLGYGERKIGQPSSTSRFWPRWDKVQKRPTATSVAAIGHAGGLCG